MLICVFFYLFLLLPFRVYLPPNAKTFLPFAKLISKKIGFLSKKTYFFNAKNLIFLKLFSERAAAFLHSAAAKADKAFGEIVFLNAKRSNNLVQNFFLLKKDL